MEKGVSMNRPGIIAAALAVTLAASVSAQTTATLSIPVGGTNRSTVIHVPAGTEKPAVVFFIHGAGGSGAGFQRDTKGDATADKEKFIAVYPSASNTGASGTWQDMQGQTNFPFFLAILDTLDKRYQIDRKKIYMTGFSQGGFISFAAACFYSDVFAAVAPVSGHIGSTNCSIKRPVPVFMTWGASEGTSFLKDRDLWVKLNKCSETSTMTKPYPAGSSSKAVRVAYSTCDQGTQVILDSIIGQGHQWPSASNLVQSDEVWSFFKQYTLGSATAARPQNLSQSRLPISVTYAAGLVRLDGIGQEAQVEVTDTKGNLIATATTARRQFAFAGKPSGVYLATVRGNGISAAQKFIVP